MSTAHACNVGREVSTAHACNYVTGHFFFLYSVIHLFILSLSKATQQGFANITVGSAQLNLHNLFAGARSHMVICRP